MTKRTRPRRVAPPQHDPESVRWAREAKGWKQVDLARELDISASLLCEIEAGTRGATPALLIRMAAVLNCPVSVLESKRPVTHIEPDGAVA